MPGNIKLECNISPADIANFTAALSRYQKETQRSAYDALRSSTVDLIKSLRKQTKQSKPTVPNSAFRFGESEPKYITVDGKMRRRMVKAFGRKGKNFVFFEPVEVTYQQRRLKNGGIAESWKEQTKASLIRSAKQKYGKILNRGLAKHSWGWFLWRLFNLPTGTKFLNKKVRLTHRHVDGGIKQERAPLPDGTIDIYAPIKCTIEIINRLRYINRAMPPGALTVAIQAATRSINYKIDNGLKSKGIGT